MFLFGFSSTHVPLFGPKFFLRLRIFSFFYGITKLISRTYLFILNPVFQSDCLVLLKKKIYIFGSIMWDIIGKPSETIQRGKDCSGHICEKPGGVAFNVALGLSKSLEKSGFELSLVSAIGRNEKTHLIETILKENGVDLKYLIIKGTQNDHYLSIETKNGEIFGSINCTNTFLSNQVDVIKHFSSICSGHKRDNDKAIFIFDGNCTKEFLDYVKKEADEKIFTKYFIPANFSKLIQFENNADYFEGFNLIINLKEANILLGSRNLNSSEHASRAIFNKIKTENCLTIVTNGPNIACGVTNEEIVKVRPKLINNTKSRLGAGDAFFAYFLSHKELNPKASLKKSLNVANKKTEQYLTADD